MENAADALKMAAAVFVFVLALSISMNAFSEVRATATTLLEYNDREYDYSYVEEVTDDMGNLVTERVVGAETIIPTIYKSYKENYKIVFKTSIGGPLYKKNGKDVYKIDLAKEGLASDSEKFRFLRILLNGTNDPNEINYFQTNKGIIFPSSEPLYNRIRNKSFKEYLGIYYQVDLLEANDVSGTPNNDVNTPDSNKNIKKVITYELLT